MLVGAVEKEGDEGADLVAQGGFGGGEGRLGDKFVVLCVWSASRVHDFSRLCVGLP